MNGINLRANNAPWRGGVEFQISQVNYRQMFVVQELKFEEIKEGEICQPSLVINNNNAQVLMDDLWHCGFRPSEGTGSAGSLRATEKHLDDMRKIIFEHYLNFKK